MGRKILVRAPNWLGDAVMATPFIKKLKDKNPNVTLHVLVKPSLTDLFADAPGVDRVLPLKKEEGPLALAKTLRIERYDTAYILPPSFSSALAPWLAKIPERIGYNTDRRIFLLTNSQKLDERFHYVRRYLGLLGVPGEEITFRDFYVPEAPTADTEIHLGKEEGKILAVAPGSRAPARRWFPERFAQVINGLGSDWKSVLLLGAPEDVPFSEAVASQSQRPIQNLCGKTSVPLVVALLKRCTALLTNESGLMHLGWATGVPTVVIAGPSNPRLTSPFGNTTQILQAQDIPCVPCVRNTCPRWGQGNGECMKAITVEMVTKALHGPNPDKSFDGRDHEPRNGS